MKYSAKTMLNEKAAPTDLVVHTIADVKDVACYCWTARQPRNDQASQSAIKQVYHAFL